MKNDSLSKHSHPLRWILAIAIAATTITSVGVVYQVFPLRWNNSSPSESKATTPPITKVAALGRLEPESEVIRLDAPFPLDGDRTNCDR